MSCPFVSFEYGGVLARARNRPREFCRSVVHAVFRTRAVARDSARHRRTGLFPAHPDSGKGDPSGLVEPRFAGRRPNRHRQNRGLHAAHSGAPEEIRQYQRVPGDASAARPGVVSYPRIGGSDRRQRQELHQIPASARHHGVWRRQYGPANSGTAPRRGNPDRHAGTPARPHPAKNRSIEQGGSAGAGRRRPHAGYGFHSGHPQDHGHAAQRASDSIVLRHFCAGDQTAGR